MEKELGLQGLNVVCFETRHAKTMGDLVALQGGRPVLAPSLKEVPLAKNPEVFAFGKRLFADQIDLLILLTGVGARALVEVLETEYPREMILDALKRIQIIPRGPKPIRVLNEWKVPYALTVPEPNTWKELLDSLDAHGKIVPLAGKKVAVQEYGIPNPELVQGLKARGAEVFQVPVYRWELPDDLKPMKEAIAKIMDGRADVVVFTTAVQIEHVLKVASAEGKKEPLVEALRKCVVASVGPDCTAALRTHGVMADIEPSSPKMGSLVSETALKASKILKGKKGRLELFSKQDILESVFLKACRREKTPYTPVWLMRQAGRYMKDYRQVREKYGFLELCKNPSLAAEVTVHAQETLGVDAAIIFSDILLILEPMGFDLTFIKGGGPVIANPLGATSDMFSLKSVKADQSLSFVIDAIRETRKRLSPVIPLIGFSGAPFTLASYMIEGGATKVFTKTHEFMTSDWDRWNVLMNKITAATVDYLNAQIRAGAQAVQLFDSWVGILTPEEYRMYAMPYSKSVLSRLDRSAPSIHFGTGTGAFLEAFAAAGANVVGVDSNVKLSSAWNRIGMDHAIQGNLDPKFLLTGGVALEMEIRSILDQAQGRPGHIFNLGHGVLPETPEEHAKDLVRLVHQWSQR